MTYEPGELQALYDEELQKIVKRTETITTIVPRRRHKVFRRPTPLDPVCSNPTYTLDYSGASAIVTSLLWSRSAPSWVSVTSTSSAKVDESDNVRAFAEPEVSLGASSRTGEWEGAHNESEPEPKNDLGACEEGFPVCAQPKDAIEEQRSTLGGSDTALESLTTGDVLAPDVSPETLTPRGIPVPDQSLPQETSTTNLNSTSPVPPLLHTPLPISTGDVLPRSLSVDSSPTVASLPSVDLPSHARGSLSLDEADDTIIGDGIAAALKKYKPITGQKSRTVLLEIAGMLKAEHTRRSECTYFDHLTIVDFSPF